MTQTAFLRELDGQIMAAFAGIGMADTGSYTPAAGGGTIEVQVMVDRSMVENGFETLLQANQVRLTLLRSEIGDADPAKGSLVVVGTDSYLIENFLARDESMVQVLARKQA